MRRRGAGGGGHRSTRCEAGLASKRVKTRTRAPSAEELEHVFHEHGCLGLILVSTKMLAKAISNEDACRA